AIADGGAARVVVLENDRGGLSEELHEPQRAVEVEEVVVRQLLAMKDPGARHSLWGTVLHIERGTLMRVLAVAQDRPPPEVKVEPGGERCAGLLASGCSGKIAGDRAIVTGRVVEGGLRQREASGSGRAAMRAELLDERGVLVGRGHDGHGRMVL